MEAAHLMLPVQEPLTRLTPGTSGAMGVGLPFAIAAKIARPDRPVVAICGDFALGLSLAEMETAVRYRVPIIVLVANNGGNGGTQRQKIYFPPDYPEGVSEFVEDARYDLIMSAFGGLGLRVERPDELAPAFLRALRANRPTCIDVRTHRDLPMQRYW
jgi:thiamine pyrophosphate-dependent acetolactate synthase large subunit-like protein